MALLTPPHHHQKLVSCHHPKCPLREQDFFFSSRMADVAVWLGPYMTHNGPQGPTMQANNNKPKATQNNRTIRKSPSQICVSPRGKANQTHKRGQSPNANNHKQKICLRTQRFDHCVFQKHAKNELPTTTFSETCRSTHRTCLRQHQCRELYMFAGLQNCLSQRPLRCARAGGHKVKSINRPILCWRECRSGHCDK